MVRTQRGPTPQRIVAAYPASQYAAREPIQRRDKNGVMHVDIVGEELLQQREKCGEILVGTVAG